MTSRQLRQWKSIKKSLDTLRQRGFNHPEIVSSTKDLIVVEKRIAELARKQSFATTGDAKRIKILREELRVRYMLRISRRAKVLLTGVAGIREDFHVPHAKASTKELIDAARRIAKHYRTYEKSFLGVGYAKDLGSKFEATIDAFEKWSANADTAISRRSFATKSLPEELALARNIIGSIDATVRSELADDEVAVRTWKPAKRVPGRIGRPKKRRKPPQPPDSSR
jgi:hypothetical protein